MSVYRRALLLPIDTGKLSSLSMRFNRVFVLLDPKQNKAIQVYGKTHTEIF